MMHGKTLTGRQKAFCEEYLKDHNAKEAAIRAGYAEKSAKVSGHYNITNHNCVALINRFKADLAAESKFTREKQLKDLEQAKEMAISQENPSAMTSAIREQNEMLGYHRETAPNLEKEQAKKELSEQESKEIKRIAAERTSELSFPRINRA